MVTPSKSDVILFLGEGYLKYWEVNFTNKIVKENSMNLLSMKTEKESSFVDMDYIPVKNAKQNEVMFAIITSNSNSIFIFEGD